MRLLMGNAPFVLGASACLLLANCSGGGTPLTTTSGASSGSATASASSSGTSSAGQLTSGTSTTSVAGSSTGAPTTDSGTSTGSGTAAGSSTGGQTTSGSSTGSGSTTDSGTTGSSSAGSTGTSGGVAGTASGTNGTGSGAGTGTASGTSGGGSTGSSTGGNSTGGTTSGVDAGCGPSGYGNEFDDCTANGTSGICACTLVCANDSSTIAGKACEQTCMMTSDCSDPATHCVGGFCQLNPCGTFLKDGGANGSENGPCDALGTSDGTCISNPYQGKGVHSDSNFAFVCVRPGSSSGPCVAPQLVSTDATTCPAGQVCSAPILLHNTANGALATANGAYRVPMGSYALGACAPLCDLSGLYDAGCASGLSCLSTALSGGNTGICSSDGGNGCATALTGTEFGGPAGNSCASNFDCACPQSCVSDAQFGQVCEAPCSADSDCPNAGEVCDVVADGGVCSLRFCGSSYVLPDGGASPDYFATCTVDQSNDGTCVPTYSESLSDNLGSGNIGVCVLGGTATTSCDPAMGSSDATQLCPTEQTCFGGQCLALCDPSNSPGYPTCPPGIACYQISSNYQAGVCLGACLPTGANCINGGDCCSELCGGTCN